MWSNDNKTRVNKILEVIIFVPYTVASLLDVPIDVQMVWNKEGELRYRLKPLKNEVYPNRKLISTKGLSAATVQTPFNYRLAYHTDFSGQSHIHRRDLIFDR